MYVVVVAVDPLQPQAPVLLHHDRSYSDLLLLECRVNKQKTVTMQGEVQPLLTLSHLMCKR